MVLGFSEPIHFFDEVPFRQLAVNYAFHLQYSPPIVPVYWWTYFYKSTAWSHIHGRTIHDRHKKSTCNAKYICNENPYLDLYWNFAHRNYGQLEFFYDKSRLALYKAIETILECRGFPGKACLIRSICEVSRRPFYERNSLPRILNAIFIPLTKNTDHKFVHAKHLGSHGLICKKIYWNCEDGVKWLQKL
ncbi:uncharacterized protein LOC129906455 isoform X2 [Episyrphus balteatus]|nr:uncharacterized protein LOC129906455 isoform X2 [Episyrphus balteatus]